jgi:hypothetical protein
VADGLDVISATSSTTTVWCMDKREELQRLEEQYVELREKRAAQKSAMQARTDNIEYPMTEAGNEELSGSTEELQQLERRLSALRAEVYDSE